MATIAIGQPISRKDGVAKVTGAARYAADFVEASMAYAQLVTSTVAKGRIAELDTSLAEAAPGVLLVLTHRNLDRLEPLSFIFAGGQAQSSFMPLMSDEIRYAGQTIALVIAETQEAADDAARRIGSPTGPSAPPPGSATRARANRPTRLRRSRLATLTRSPPPRSRSTPVTPRVYPERHAASWPGETSRRRTCPRGSREV